MNTGMLRRNRFKKRFISIAGKTKKQEKNVKDDSKSGIIINWAYISRLR